MCVFMNRFKHGLILEVMVELRCDLNIWIMMIIMHGECELMSSIGKEKIMHEVPWTSQSEENIALNEH